MTEPEHQAEAEEVGEDDPNADIDTEELTLRVQAMLDQHRITQEVFGKQVVGCSQGHVHNLLYKPKPFSQLSTAGKKPYRKMRAFMREEGLEERIQELAGCKTGYTAPKKRKPDDPDMQSEARPRKKRVTLSSEQRSAMEDIYAENAYPTRQEIEDTAMQLDLPHDTVRFWFNNKRRLEKQRLRELEMTFSGEEEKAEQGSSSKSGQLKGKGKAGSSLKKKTEDNDDDDDDDDGEEEEEDDDDDDDDDEEEEEAEEEEEEEEEEPGKRPRSTASSSKLKR